MSKADRLAACREGGAGDVSFLLSPDEVSDLTGAKRRSGQLEWLREHGIPAEVGQDGRVKVLRARLVTDRLAGRFGKYAVFQHLVLSVFHDTHVDM